MPDIEEYIGEKIAVNTITDDVLADNIKKPTKKTAYKKSYPKKPNRTISNKPTEKRQKPPK
jgi:hypothetical protein